MEKELAPILTVAAAAAYLGVIPKRLEIWRMRGYGPTFIRLSHCCVRYRLEDLDRWLDSKTVAAVPKEAA